MTLDDLAHLNSSQIFVTGLPALYHRLLKNDAATRTLANPQLRTSEGVTAQARFGERVPIPVTTFAPIATGGINQQPITSFVYETDWRQHRHHAADPPRRRSFAGAEGHAEQHLRLAEQPAHVRQPRNLYDHPAQGRRNQHARGPDPRRRANRHDRARGPRRPADHRPAFANNRKEVHESDIVLTLTPHIVRVLDLTEADLRPFRLGRDAASAPAAPELPAATPRDRELDPLAEPAPPAFPQPRQPGTITPIR